jgi:hypothetical protein
MTQIKKIARESTAERTNSMASKPDPKVMEEVATLKAIKAEGFVDTPEYASLSMNIKRKYFGVPLDGRKKSTVTRPLYEAHDANAEANNDSDGPPAGNTANHTSTDLRRSSDGSLSGQTDQERTKTRRFKRKGDMKVKMNEMCKTIVHVHKDFGDLHEVVVPLNFVDKEGNRVDMWQVCDDGRWRCDVCPSKRKDISYDPEDNTQRLVSKLCHNRYRAHHLCLLKVWQPPSGFAAMELPKRFAKYSEAVDFYNKSDRETRKGAFPSS